MVQTKSGVKVIDEIENFLDGSYTGATQSLWHLNHFPLRSSYPPVKKLPLHLENEQTVLYDDDDDMEEVLDRYSKTALTEFFTLNRVDERARNIIYTDIFRYYTFDKKNKIFHYRKRNTGKDDDDGPLSDTVGRIPVIPLTPFSKERYFLRVLLHHVKGPQSFDDLKTVNGVVKASYQEACIELGLYEDDTAIKKAFEEAATIKFGTALMECFVVLCLYANPGNPKVCSLHQFLPAKLSYLTIFALLNLLQLRVSEHFSHATSRTLNS